MRQLPPLYRQDASDVRFWRRTLRAGVALSVVTCVFISIYALWTWERPDRTLLLATCCAALVGSLILLVAPLDRVLASPRRWIFFLAWSTALIPTIAVFIGQDGGARSPLTATFFLPLIFAALAYPLRTMLLVGVGDVVAYLVVALGQPHDPAAVFVFACTLSAGAWMCAWQSRLHDRQRAELARVSRADPLTGCLNRRGLEERFDGELARATRHARELSVVLIDLDRFKAVNDRNGHAAGDALLCWTVDRIGESIRPMDALGRLGGDEFAVVLPDADEAEAREIAARIEMALAERTGASTGTATFPADGIVADELHARADARLYEAKAGHEPVAAA